jgi:hypothetical protein
MAPSLSGSSTRRAPLPLALGAALCLSACGDDGPADPSSAAATPEAGGAGSPATPPAGGAAEALARPAGDLIDVAAERGVDYVNVSGEADKPTILEANGAGVALFDLGGDGDLDLAFTQGLASLGALTGGEGADLELFANDGRARFERQDGPGLAGWWTGLAAGDVDNDGDDDLIAAGFGGLELLRQSEGRMERFAGSGLMPITPGASFTPGAEREPGAAPLWATSLGLADFDRDGVLDLYVGQYLELDPLDPPLGALGVGALSVPCVWKGHPVYCGPRGLAAQPDRVLKGLGDGHFEDRTAAWLPEHPPGFTLAVAPFDADSDGDTDVYVANDSVANLLWDGMDEAGMGIAVGDVNRDGKVDIAVTNFSDEPTHLFYGSGRGFSTQTYRMGLSVASKRLLSWSTHLVDFDGDGFLDLFTANGHVYPQADKPNTGTRYGQADTLWRVGGRSRVEAFEPTSEASLLSGELGTRGSAFGDLDGDGRPDLVTCTIDGPARVGLNTFDGGHRLSLRLLGAEGGLDTGPRTPRDGTGARVVVVPEFPVGTPDNAQFALLAEVQRSTGYQSASTPWIHLGLGELTRFSELRVIWPSGRTDVLEAGDLDRRLTIREGEGLVSSEAFASPTVQ